MIGNVDLYLAGQAFYGRVQATFGDPASGADEIRPDFYVYSFHGNTLYKKLNMRWVSALAAQHLAVVGDSSDTA